MLVGSLFFFAGATFCYTVVFDFGFPFFLAEYDKIGVAPAIRIGEYLSFSSRLLLAFGITFQLPVVTFFLARIGMVTHHTLIRYARYAVLATFILRSAYDPLTKYRKRYYVRKICLLVKSYRLSMIAGMRSGNGSKE